MVDPAASARPRPDPRPRPATTVAAEPSIIAELHPSPGASTLVLRRTAVASLSVRAVVGASLAATGTAHAVATSSAVVISEVYGGGGNSGAQSRNDFIELYNKGPSPVSVSGWSVQYSSTTGATWAATPLTGSIAPGAYYLVAERAGSNTAAAPLPPADATGSLAMSGTNGKIALVTSSAALTCGTVCSTAAGVLDFVGYGSATDLAGSPTPALSNTTSANRKVTPFTNTGDNANDFTIEAPTPKAAAPTPPPPLDCSGTPTPSECVPGPLSIQDIQAPGFLSPQRGNTVERVPGVVTAVRSSGSSRGFWIQQTNPDAGRPSSSSGIFVFTSSTPVSVGDAVLVTGKVTDYDILSSGDTLATTANLSTTEITPTTVTTASTGNALPAPLLLTPTTVPGTYAPTVTGGNNIETIDPVNPTNSALAFWEAHEGMLVQVDNARVVGPGKPQYGEISVTTKPADLATPRGGNYLASYADTPTGRLLVSPVNGSVPSANVGDLLVGPTVGPVDWSTFGGYDIAATQLGTYQDKHLTGSTAGTAAPDQLSIATYNVENLAPGDPADKYARLGAGVVTNLRSPDVITLEEIQVNSGSTNDGTVAADATLNKLTAAISAAGGPAYSWSQINPVDGQDGGQPGGNIRVAFLSNTDRVTLAPGTAGDSTTAVSASTAPTAPRPSRSTRAGSTRPTKPGRAHASRSPVSSSSRARRSSSSPTTSTPRAATRVPTAGSSRRTAAARCSAASRPRCSTASSSRCSRPTPGQRRAGRRLQRLPVLRSGADTHRQRHDVDRPDQHAARERALHLRLQRRLPGPRPHLPVEGRHRRAVRRRPRELRVLGPVLRPRPAGRPDPAEHAVGNGRPRPVVGRRHRDGRAHRVDAARGDIASG